MSGVLYRLLPLVIALAGAPERPESYPMHTNRSEPFSLRVPPGWSVQDTTYYIMSRFEVFALARNRLAAGVTPNFSKNWQSGNEVNLSAGLSSNVGFAEDLPPGGAIVMFSRFEGGPPVDCNFIMDRIGQSLVSVDTLGMDFSKPFHFSFVKWGRLWDIDVMTRNATPDDRLAIRDLLRSIVFEPVPVVSAGQAAQLAFQTLPPEVRMSGDACRLFHVDVTEADGIFEALFRACRTCGCRTQPVEAMEGEWRYRVRANGVVEAVGP